MKTVLPFIGFFFCFGSGIAAQDRIEGNWYTFTRNNAIQFTITKDSIITRKMDWELRPAVEARHFYQAVAIVAGRQAKGKFYLAVKESVSDDDRDQSPNRVPNIYLNIFMPADSGRQLHLTGHDTSRYSGPASMDRFIEADTVGQSQMILLSEEAIRQMKKLPPITTMTTADCIEYFKRMKTLGKAMEKEARGYNLGQGYFMFRYVMAELGYSPLFTKKQYDAWAKRFEAEPATRDFFEEPDIE